MIEKKPAAKKQKPEKPETKPAEEKPEKPEQRNQTEKPSSRWRLSRTKKRETPVLDELDEDQPQQGLFVREYCKDLNGTQAAIRAGYSVDSAASQASDLLRKPDTQEVSASVSASILLVADRVQDGDPVDLPCYTSPAILSAGTKRSPASSINSTGLVRRHSLCAMYRARAAAFLPGPSRN